MYWVGSPVRRLSNWCPGHGLRGWCRIVWLSMVPHCWWRRMGWWSWLIWMRRLNIRKKNVWRDLSQRQPQTHTDTQTPGTQQISLFQSVLKKDVRETQETCVWSRYDCVWCVLFIYVRPHTKISRKKTCVFQNVLRFCFKKTITTLIIYNNSS